MSAFAPQSGAYRTSNAPDPSAPIYEYRPNALQQAALLFNHLDGKAEQLAERLAVMRSITNSNVLGCMTGRRRC